MYTPIYTFIYLYILLYTYIYVYILTYTYAYLEIPIFTYIYLFILIYIYIYLDLGFSDVHDVRDQCKYRSWAVNSLNDSLFPFATSPVSISLFSQGFPGPVQQILSTPEGKPFRWLLRTKTRCIPPEGEPKRGSERRRICRSLRKGECRPLILEVYV